ncbi:MAG: c-type cytochrome [Rhodospirillaceae bacterium]|nr:c-type cytochrome [Rhodospirillaceae bacterium]
MSFNYRRSVLIIWLVGFFAVVLAPSASASSLVERGKYLTEGIAGCGNCHTPWGGPMKGKYLAGGNSFGDDKAPFKSYAPNITPDMETGIGTWTDAQLITAIREGTRPDGSVIGPPMAIEFYNGMSDHDVKSIVAYLRTVKPIRNSTPKSVYRMKLIAQKPAGKVADVSPSKQIAFGAYLVLIGHCMECHTPFVKGRMVLAKFGAGGRVFPGPWGESVSPNITPDKNSGIGDWTDAQIKRAITKGVRHDGTKLRPPMGFGCYSQMSEADVDAVVAYLRTIKPVEN